MTEAKPDTVITDFSQFDAPFPKFLGIKLTHVSATRVEAELPARQELATIPDIMHGGVMCRQHPAVRGHVNDQQPVVREEAVELSHGATLIDSAMA